MKLEWKKAMAVFLSAAMIGGCLTAGALAGNGKKQTANGETTSAGASTDEAAKLSKDESVYVLAKADGSVEKIIVSDWIRNSLGSATVTDRSELDQVENVKGDESYTMNADNMRVWNADGKDIYSQGTIEKELPVSLKVTYSLDGRNISAEELAGKSGKVTIRYSYENRQYEMVEIDGKKEKIYVPFAMVTGLLLDNEHFTNVTVTNGKLINDGNRTAVIGIAFPGLNSNLALSDNDVQVPDYVEMTADVTSFEMSNTVTIATNSVFNELDTDKMDSLDGLKESFGQLSTAMTQLMDGSSRLYSGLCTLLDKSGELISGIDQLAAGMQELTQHNEELNAGSTKVFQSLLSLGDAQLKAAGLDLPSLTIENYGTVLKGVLNSLSEENVKKQANDQALSTVTEEAEEQVRATVTATVRSQKILPAVLAKMGISEETYNALKDLENPTPQQEATLKQIDAAVEAQMNADTTVATIDALVQQNMKSEEIQARIQQTMASQKVQGQIQAALDKAAAGRTAVQALKDQLDEYSKFHTGLAEYTAGVTKVYDGILTMKEGAPALQEGVSALKDGSMQLSDGLKAFNDQGIAKISETVNGGLSTLATRLKATIDVSKNYRSFSGISDDMSGQMKFIYRTEAIEAKTAS